MATTEKQKIPTWNPEFIRDLSEKVYRKNLGADDVRRMIEKDNAIMITGAVWEKVVFGQFLFAPAFFWEDVFSFVVIALHSWYLWALFSGGYTVDHQMAIALAAYAAYAVNATQFLLKLRHARLDQTT